MRRRLWLSIGIAGVAVLLAILGFGLSQASRVGTRFSGSEDAAGTPLAGKPAPGFRLAQLDGGPRLDLAQFRGNVVVLNFWASWCAGCRREHPALMAAFERYRDRGVVFLGVIFQDSPGQARRFLQEMGDGYPALMDPGSRTAVTYGVYGVPETFFIDPSGKIVARRIGESSYELLTNRIERMLASR